jgi:hypothetical protein
MTMDGTTGDYIAVPVDDEEHERVAAEIGNGIVFKIRVGFSPQRCLRLDPVETLRQRHDHVSPAVSAAEHGGHRRRHLGIDAGDGVVLAHVFPPAC